MSETLNHRGVDVLRETLIENGAKLLSERTRRVTSSQVFDPKSNGLDLLVERTIPRK